MCLCNFEKTDREEDIVIPNRPILQSSPRQSRVIPISPPSQSGHSLSILPPPRSQAQPIDLSQSRPRREVRELNASGRLVVVERITPRSSNPAVVHEPRRSAGSLGYKKGPGSPRHSNVLVTPRQSETVVISPRSSGQNVAQGPPLTTRPVIRSRRESTASYRSPRQSTASVRSASYRSTRERMAEVDEGGVRRDYDRRDDLRR